MRQDLNKQLCERERRGSRYSFHSRRHAKKFAPDAEGEAPAREGIKFRYGYDDKSFNENLNPLRGIVRKAVGRPYSKFYSDLCKVFDKRSVINQHILGHLDDFLTPARDLFFDANDVLMVQGRYTGTDYPFDGEFYVDPRDGIIKRNRRYRTGHARHREREAQKARERAAEHRDLPDGSVLHKIGDVWFHYTVKDAPVGHYVYDKPANKELFKPSRWSKPTTWERLRDYERRHCGVKRFVGADQALDLLTGERVFSEPGEPPKKYHATKRTASHKTLKQVGLAS